MHLGPLTFGEFLRGLGENHLIELSRRRHPVVPWANTAHEKPAARQREFLLVDGMPEAVAVYAADEGIESVRQVQRSIVATYRDDFAKYGSAPAMLVRLQTVFDYLPSALGKKIKYSNMSRDERAREARSALDLLSLSWVAWQVHHGDCSGVPLAATLNPYVYRCLFMDLGLVSLITGVDWHKLGKLDERQLVNEGGLTEQFIGQHLLFHKAGIELPSHCYWLREGKGRNAEVDFVIEHGRTIVPVEVKSGTAGSLRSVHQFLAREIRSDMPLVLRFDLNPPGLSQHEHRLRDGKQVRYELLSLPLYVVDRCERLLERVCRG